MVKHTEAVFKLQSKQIRAPLINWGKDLCTINLYDFVIPKVLGVDDIGHLKNICTVKYCETYRTI